MKKLIFTSILGLFSLVLSAQSEPTCYQKYAKVFEERGANDVKDGEHDVVVTIRKGSFADCFIGKVKVVNGLVVQKSIQLTFVDGTYENFERQYKFDDPIAIVNGISETMVSSDEELINVMFVDDIKPKKKALKRAPEPDFDL